MFPTNSGASVVVLRALLVLVAGCRVDSKGIVLGDAGAVDASDGRRPTDALVVDAPAIEGGHDDGGHVDGGGGGGGGRANGEACTLGEDCATGACVDGICCESACTGDCEACNVAGQVGSCVPLKGMPRPGRPACLGQGTPCAGACDGSDRDACKYPAGETTCAPAACAAGKAVARAVCSGGGVCLPATEVSCAPYACDGPICAGGCSASNPCTAGHHCNAGRCMALGVAGAACAAGDQCATGFCVDGRCCGQKACSACEACTGSNGTCAKLTSGTDPDSCAGTCAPGGCKKPGGQACSAPSECLSGFCATGRCCDRACNAPCESCNLSGKAGTCGPIDMTGDPNNCGACKARCSASHVAPMCTAGKCSGACQSGWGDCNANKATDGCETNLNGDALNCGACGTKCPGTRCLSGACEKITFTWVFAGFPPAGQTCISLNEPADPHFWGDNQLCTQRDFGLQWSSAGPIAGMVCTKIEEPSDPHTWTDNFLCAPVDYGLRWSFASPIVGMRCTLINEPSEPALHAWTDNYLCAP